MQRVHACCNKLQLQLHLHAWASAGPALVRVHGRWRSFACAGQSAAPACSRHLPDAQDRDHSAGTSPTLSAAHRVVGGQQGQHVSALHRQGAGDVLQRWTQRCHACTSAAGAAQAGIAELRACGDAGHSPAHEGRSAVVHRARHCSCSACSEVIEGGEPKTCVLHPAAAALPHSQASCRARLASRPGAAPAGAHQSLAISSCLGMRDAAAYLSLARC